MNHYKKTQKRSRTFAVLTLGLSLGLVMLGCQPGTESTPKNAPREQADLAITNVTLVDPVAGVRPGMTVVLAGDKIVSVAPSTDAIANAKNSIDGSHQYLIPGLWDMHVHITYEPELVEHMAGLFLDYGITSVRDTGGMLPKLLPEIEKWRASDAVAPRIFFSGPLLDGAKIVYDGDDRPEIGIANPTPEAAKENVARLKAAGADFIKIYELVSPEVFNALVEGAEQNNLPIASHVPLSLLANHAGPKVGSMEHLRNVELACSHDADNLLSERSQILAQPGDVSGYSLRSALHSEFRPRALANVDIKSERCAQVIASLQSTVQVPTLRLNTIFQQSPISRDDWRLHLAKLPSGVADVWQETAQRFLGVTSEPGVQMAAWSLKLVGAMHAAGVPIGAGTDTPIGQAIPGYSLHTELERLVEAGLTPLEAIHSATIRPAEFLRLQDSYGQIKTDFVGDLVLLSADPTVDIRNTRKISTVISKGQIVR